ncbi:MAG: 16S rRNA (cytosine(1402)-N(4))-methyltransferase RsmH [Bacteroidetes bacterium]|nr:16S rRNA (cytosine(1402)-N(4))-methyltransferase RsmH [Bacteroidota bacterium]
MNPTGDLNARDNTEPWLNYASSYHAPVLCHDVIQGLVTRKDGVYVDGTLGGGGHTAALLDALSASGSVIAIDQDEDAIAEASKRLAPALSNERLRILKGNFGDMASLLDAAGITQVDGLLLDLGVSSHQLDEAERGFSHRMKGPLDMRMDSGQAFGASELVNEMEESDLMHVMFQYGEEPKARRIARDIVKARPILTTEKLAEVVRWAAPRGQEAKTLARVFQAIRIAVNRELDVLDQVLRDSIDLISLGGRLAIISYHSLEDRRAKHFLRTGNLEGEIKKDLYGNKLTPWVEINRKPITADQAEQIVNPRSRSARLRIAERQAFGDDL